MYRCGDCDLLCSYWCCKVNEYRNCSSNRRNMKIQGNFKTVLLQ